MNSDLRGLSKRFRDVLAVDGVSAVAHPGQVMSLRRPRGVRLPPLGRVLTPRRDVL